MNYGCAHKEQGFGEYMGVLGVNMKLKMRLYLVGLDCSGHNCKADEGGYSVRGARLTSKTVARVKRRLTNIGGKSFVGPTTG